MRLGVSFQLSQCCVTHYGYTNLTIITLIANFLGVKVNPIRQDRKHPQYRVRTSTIKSNQKLQNYLYKFPLKGTKHIDFKE